MGQRVHVLPVNDLIEHDWSTESGEGSSSTTASTAEKQTNRRNRHEQRLAHRNGRIAGRVRRDERRREGDGRSGPRDHRRIRTGHAGQHRHDAHQPHFLDGGVTVLDSIEKALTAVRDSMREACGK